MCMQPAASQMHSILEDPARRQKVQSSLPWLEIIALVLRQQCIGQAPAEVSLLSKVPKLEETIPEALRYLYRLHHNGPLGHRVQMSEAWSVLAQTYVQWAV